VGILIFKGLTAGRLCKSFGFKGLKPVLGDLLTDDQKENRVEISQELFANANGNENILKNIITGDETWVYGYDVETKMQSSQWMGKESPRPKKHALVGQRSR
jgi:hypothetical protein